MKLIYCPECGAQLKAEDNTKFICSNGHPYYNNPHSSATVVFRNDSGQVLVIKRGREPFKDKYDLPSGFLNYDETPIQAAVREMHEELGVDIAGADLNIIDSGSHEYEENDAVCAFIFECRKWQGDMKASDDAAAIEWKPLEFLKSDAMAWPYDKLYEKITTHAGQEGRNDREYEEADQITTLLDGAHHIVVIQADNPDADSLGSALSLEHVLGEMGKEVSLYCGTDIPSYLHYLEGWDRVQRELPKQFDASIFVDVSTLTLIEKLKLTGEMSWVAAKPSIVLDHHGTVDNRIDFATILLTDDKSSSTGELVYHLAKQLKWPLKPAAGENLMTAILGDTQGLSNDLASAETYRVMAELVDLGVNRPVLEEKRREYIRMPDVIYQYKGVLIGRTEFSSNGRIAHVTVPQNEIVEYSPFYNPAPLVQNDMLNVSGVCLSIVFKSYDDGRTTAAIRANPGFAVADKLAEKMGGGGHPYASGFKQVTTRPFNEIKSECIEFATELLNNLTKEPSDETLQHTYSTD